MPDYSDIGFCIKQIHDRLEKQANNAMRSSDLTMMQVSVLLALQESGEKQMSMKELEKKLRDCSVHRCGDRVPAGAEGICRGFGGCSR